MGLPMRRLPSLAGLRAFEAAARHLSFKPAAEELHVTPTAISHQVRQLEAALGAPLFERRTRQVVLTPEGHVLLPVLSAGFDSFARTIEGLTRRSRRAVVTLSATPAFAAKWLVPRLAPFRKQRPDIDLRLLATLEVVDVKSGVADLALRYGRGPYPDLIAEQLTTDPFSDQRAAAAPALTISRRVPLVAVEVEGLHSANSSPSQYSTVGPGLANTMSSSSTSLARTLPVSRYSMISPRIIEESMSTRIGESVRLMI